MKNIIAVLQSFCFPNCDIFFNRTFNLKQPLTTCSERVKNVYPKNVYQTQETLFEKLDFLRIEYTNEQTLLKNLAIFVFEPFSMQEEGFKDTDTTNRFRKRFPISVSISSNLVKEPIFLCNCDPHHLVTSFIGALQNLAFLRGAITKSLFFDFETTIKIKLGSILEKLTQRHKRRESRQIWTTAITRLVPLLSSNSSKRNSYWICISIWNVIAMFYLSLVSTAQNMISS